MRLPAALVLATALPLQAQTVDPLPDFSLDAAISCLAFTISEIESDPEGKTAASRAEVVVFFSTLIAAKSTPADAKTLGDQFAEELRFFRAPSYEEGAPATPEEADEILTGTGKMCWFNALAAEGGPFAEP
jgi:hypothetical protein